MDEQGSTSPHKRVRRATRLPNLIRNRNAGQKESIEIDESSGKPRGTNKQKAQFNSFVALLARSKVSILKNSWDEVEDSVKEQIWQSIQVCSYILVLSY